MIFSKKWDSFFRVFWNFCLDAFSLASLGTFFFLLASLLSYSPYDPSSSVIVQGEPDNLMGYTGAFISDLLFQWLGIGAFVFDFLFLLIFICFALRKPIGLWITLGLCVSFFLGLTQQALFPELDMLYPNGFAVWFFTIQPHWASTKTVYGTVLVLIGISLTAYIYRKLRRKLAFQKAENALHPDSFIVEPQKGRHRKVKKHSALGSAVSALSTDPIQKLPPLTFLSQPPILKERPETGDWVEENVRRLQKVLEEFGVKGSIVNARPGPIVTLYELEPCAGVKSSRIISLADDIARSMSTISARISVIPGKNLLGIELSNTVRHPVYLRELLSCTEYNQFEGALALVLGKDIGGQPVVVDLTKMPHLLVAGTTGSGKSVGINSMILSLLYRLSPDQCKLLMIDPKMLELSVYEGIPHLLTPVVTDPKKAITALKWTVQEMENRYRKMSQMGVRNISGYNERIARSKLGNEPLERKVQLGFGEDDRPFFENQVLDSEEMPYIVVIVDEMADLMLVAGKELEVLIQRLAQMARAAGIHLIMATQRPSVDVITGTIKANFPARISFQVTSKIDSRTILGEQGAEHLLGQGDMLFMSSGGGRITRVHGPYVSEHEIEKVVAFLIESREPAYVDMSLKEEESATSLPQEPGDPLYQQALAIVQRDKKVSTSYIQRQLQIGYNRAARIVEQMEQEGLISPPNHAGKRQVLF
jgi:S-DNA-T family DNA segregation ATPase FtsK/SpoIIIE